MTNLGSLNGPGGFNTRPIQRTQPDPRPSYPSQGGGGSNPYYPTQGGGANYPRQGGYPNYPAQGGYNGYNPNQPQQPSLYPSLNSAPDSSKRVAAANQASSASTENTIGWVKPK